MLVSPGGYGAPVFSLHVCCGPTEGYLLRCAMVPSQLNKDVVISCEIVKPVECIIRGKHWNASVLCILHASARVDARDKSICRIAVVGNIFKNPLHIFPSIPL